MRRIEMLEAQVSDRDGLLAKLSRQQARLDRLECLARENEMLRAQMRGDRRAEHERERRPAQTGQRRPCRGHGVVHSRSECTMSPRGPGADTERGPRRDPDLGNTSPKGVTLHVPAAELENRLDELELALGLQPRPLRSH